MPNNDSPLHEYVDEHPQELRLKDEVAAGGMERLLRLVEPLGDCADDGPAQAA